jgi:hypothetical protein
VSFCGFVQLVCSVPGCDTPFEVMGPTPEDLHEPLCPLHQKARLVQDEESGCDQVGEWIAGR